jgi:hypothetical protein
MKSRLRPGRVAEVVFPGAADQCSRIGHVPSSIHDDESFDVIEYPCLVAILVRPGFAADARDEPVQAHQELIITASQATILDFVAGRCHQGPCQDSQQESRNSSKILDFHIAAPLKQGKFVNVQGIDSTLNSLILLKYQYTCCRDVEFLSSPAL